MSGDRTLDGHAEEVLQRLVAAGIDQKDMVRFLGALIDAMADHIRNRHGGEKNLTPSETMHQPS